jgi:hypothetical protein
MKRFAIALLAAVVFLPPLSAAPVLYSLGFTGPDPLPTAGAFLYDPATGFSNFTVGWAGVTFDLTASANAPSVMTPGLCPASASDHAYGFLIMTQGVTGCDAQYGWAAFSVGGALFSFLVANTYGQEFIGAMSADLANGIYMVQGSWTATAVPEPATWAAVLLGAAALAVRAFRRAR